MELKNPLFTRKYTAVDMADNNHFIISKISDMNQLRPADYPLPEPLCQLSFQDGPIKEVGVNGIQNEDLLLIVLTRLQNFQNSEFACRENALAITKIEESVMWLRKRTLDREARGVEGTHNV